MVDWDKIELEIQEEFDQLSEGFDFHEAVNDKGQQKFTVRRWHPMSLWFPYGYDREVYLQNRLVILRDCKVWREENLEYMQEYFRKYRIKHREKRKIEKRAWYQRNKERVLAKQKANRKKDNIKFRIAERKYYEKNREKRNDDSNMRYYIRKAEEQQKRYGV